MKIASLCNAFSANGGVGNYMKRLHAAWQEAGHENFVVHADPHAEAAGDSRVFFVENFDRFRWEKDCVSRTQKVLDILKKIQPDLVHIQNSNNTVLEAAIRQKYRAVKSMQTYEFCPTGNKFHHALQKTCGHPTNLLCFPHMVMRRCTLSKRPDVFLRMYREAYDVNRSNAEFQKVIVSSEFARQKALENHYRPNQVETALYFTDYPEDIEPCSYDRQLILFSGRLVAEKGLAKLLEAVVLIKKTVPWKLAILGDGPEASKMKALAHQLKLEERVQFIGWQPLDQVRQWYKHATVVAVPSVWPEPFGAVGIEAMSYAKPVVAFGVGGIPEWLQHNESGYLIRPFEVHEMAEALQRLLESTNRAKEMGQKGRNRVKLKFSPPVHVKRLLQIYQDVVR